MGEAVTRSLEYAVVLGDALSIQADVLALKYAQRWYGIDLELTERLMHVGVSISLRGPKPGDDVFIDTRRAIAATGVLLIGTPELLAFGYQEVREFSRHALAALASISSSARSLAMTLHGPGFGLDETECALAQLGGCMDALEAGEISSKLERISLIERNVGRYARIATAIEQQLTGNQHAARLPSDPMTWLLMADVGEGITNEMPTPGFEAGITKKPRAFIAMPFATEMDDVFYFGIQGPIRDYGFVCERVDQDAYTGDVVERVKQMIDSAAVVIADLTGGNPNVYLEVGYAWGRGRPCILLIRGSEEPRFDLRGFKHLRYQRIKDLEMLLSREVAQLTEKGIIRR